MLELPDFSQPGIFLLATLAFFSVVIGRYVLIAGIFHLYFYIYRPERWRQRKISNKPFPKQQFLRELSWSTITALLFALSGTVTMLLYQLGYTKIYIELGEYGYWYLPISLAIYMLIHETYYYWLHRWMHHPKIFKTVHKVHHLSTTTSPWTAFSFHPLEGLLQAVFLPALLLLIPIHPYVLLIQLTIMTLSSVVNHLDIEIYPKHFHKHSIGKWLIGATHHSLHHKQFKYNYGLYFTFWDKVHKTESPAYETTFEKVTGEPEIKGSSSGLQ